MKKMNTPGFTAEACIYSTGNYYDANIPGISGGSRIIEAALMRLGAFECGGSCPEGTLKCTGDKNCQCCKTGCGTDKDGFVFCTHDPITLTGGRGSFGGSLGGSVFA